MVIAIALTGSQQRQRSIAQQLVARCLVVNGGPPGLRAGTRCAGVSQETSWPACVTADADLHLGTALFTVVFQFISRPDDTRHKEVIFTSDGNIGLGLREQPHDLGELVSDFIPGSQAANSDIRAGWIIRELGGKPFTKTETVIDVAADFSASKAKGATLLSCIIPPSLVNALRGYGEMHKSFTE